jgi:CheY-like chemotaxis protein
MKARILIIDDQGEIRSLVRKMLESFGCEVVEAENGHKGLQLFNENPVDLIITDIFMPEKDGLEMIRELRRSHPNLRVLAMSGGGMRGNLDVLRMARSMGAYRVLVKPFSLHEVRDAVREALGGAAPPLESDEPAG